MLQHPAGSHTPRHAQAGREGGKTPRALGQKLRFLTGWFNTTTFGRKPNEDTLAADSPSPGTAGVWAFASISASYTILRLNALSGKING